MAERITGKAVRLIHPLPPHVLTRQRIRAAGRAEAKVERSAAKLKQRKAKVAARKARRAHAA